MPLINGTESGETITGTDQNDTILGLNGDDLISDFAGDDSVIGGAGNDTFHSGSGADTLRGGGGDDQFVLASGTGGLITGGPGHDTIIIDRSTETSAVNFRQWYLDEADGTIKIDYLPDLRIWLDVDNLQMDIEELRISGGQGDDHIIGLYSSDVLRGNAGNDTIRGFYGRDTIFGGAGDDLLQSSHDHDVVYGESGNDTVVVSLSNEDQGLIEGAFADGGDDTDLLHIDEIFVLNPIDPAAEASNPPRDLEMSFIPGGRSTLSNGLVFENFEQLVWNINHGNNTLRATLTDPAIEFVYWRAGDGIDLAIVDLSATTGAFDFTRSGAQLLPANPDLPFGKQIDFGGVDRLKIYANDDENQLEGGSYRDLLFGAGGDDKIVGNAGDDHLAGQDGNDRLEGGAGNDKMVGGVGRDSMVGGSGHDTLLGKSGNDLLIGNSGRDQIFGGQGRDRLFGGAGNDQLQGENGNDKLMGGKGSDTLIGGAGNDTLRGGDGDDLFVFGLSDGQDVVDDFVVGSDNIRILDAERSISDLSFTQRDGYVEIAIPGIENVEATMLQVTGATVSELQQEDNFIFG